MDEAWFSEWVQELRHFTSESTVRLAAHEQQMQAMQAQHDDQMTGIRQIMSHIATHMIDHEERLSQHTRTLQDIATTLEAIRNRP